MSNSRLAGIVIGLALFGGFIATSASVLATSTPAPRFDPVGGFVRAPDYGKLPLAFEANEGQVDRAVRFIARGPGYQLFLTPSEAVLDLRSADKVQPAPTQPERTRADRASLAVKHDVLRIRVAGADPRAEVTGVEPYAGRSHFFLGNDPAKWQRDVRSFAKVRYAGVYPGIDLVYYGNERQLEYDFIVAPGADPKRIALDFHGARKLAIDADGNLVVTLASSTLVHRRPIVYQQIDGERRMIEGRYVMRGKSRAGFQVAAYDVKRPLVIDPVLEYSTYLGGAGNESANYIARDSAGNFYLAFYNTLGQFPVSPGARQPTPPGSGDVVILKLDPTGTQRLYATYLGSSLTDYPTGITVDASDNLYVTGGTNGANFPVTAGALQSTNPASPHNDNVFVAKIDPTGSTLIYSTLVGGPDGSAPAQIAVDAQGFAYVAGYTIGLHPTTPGAFQTVYKGGGDDAFVFKLNPTGTAFVYSTYLGGPGADAADGMVIDDQGFVYVVGGAGKDFPTTPGAFRPNWAGGIREGFLTKLNQDGSGLVFSTFLGGGTGTAYAFADSIARDTSGNIYVTGSTADGFVTLPGALQPSYGGGSRDIFAIKLDATGSTAYYATYLGGGAGGGYEYTGRIAVDAQGYLYITGGTSSTNFPVTPTAIQSAYAGGVFDGFFAVINATGSALVYSTLLGTAGDDNGYGLLLDDAGNVYISGSVGGSEFPTTADAYQQAFGGGTSDGFLVKFRPDSAVRNYQGLFYKFPAESEAGWGINFTHQGNVIFATWFTYDAAGKPLWFAAELHESAPGVFSGDVFTTTGPPFSAQPFDPTLVVETVVGTMTVTFTDTSNATFTYTINGASQAKSAVTQTKTITRQVYAQPVPGCAWGAKADLNLAVNYQDLWWAAPASSEAGWGVNFTHQGNIIFFTWFTYGADGKPLWLIAVAQRTSPGVYAGPISTVTGPAFSAVPWDPTQVVETEVGSTTITFADGNHATFTYTVNGITQTKQITRQVFAEPGTTCQ